MAIRLRVVSLLTVVGAISMSSGAVWATSFYTTTVVAPYSHPYRDGLGLNNKGHVTGGTTGAQAFFYDGSLHLLGRPAGAKFSVGQGISDTDVIAATAQIGTVRHAYAVNYASGRTSWTQLAGIPGYQQSEAVAILPDGSAIAGRLCATGDPACSHLGQHSLAVVWWRSGKVWSPPVVLSTGKAPQTSSVVGIARNGRATVVAGTIGPSRGSGTGTAVLWLLPGHQSFQLTGTSANPVVDVRAIAHAGGNTFYVAGMIAGRYEGTYGEPTMWTVSCTQSTCRQTRLQVIVSLGETYAVNSHGAVTGYQRVGGDPGGYFLWQGGKILGDTAGSTINSSGQMAGYRINPPPSRSEQVILLTPTS